MSCKSAIYLVNSGGNAVTEGNSIPVGNIVRRFGCNIAQEGSGIVLQGDGYYKITAEFTVVPTAIGVVGVTVESGGAALGSASQVYADVSGEPVCVPVVCIVRNCGCELRSFIEFVLSNGSGTVSQSSIVIEKM